PAMKPYGTILLSPKPVVLGIGCRKRKAFAELRDFAERCLASCGLTSAEVGAIASVDCKAEEPGLRQLSEYWRVPFLTFDPELLAKAPGVFRDSEFVASKVGVGNVCERAAVLGAGPGAELILPKQTGNGMTAAVARRREGGAQ
ncbi:MAG: cobalamin biosynthesis protein, partial [Mogibacterium sp.]|nr:cobalamin biosynthesis protein [Mogibacterium sp.]